MSNDSDYNEPLKVLFVCSKNQWRSPTAEAIFRKTSGLNVRSAGTSRQARRRVSVSDLRWADLVLVMEDKHKSRLKAEFRQIIRYTEVLVLDIPDDYPFMDPDLVEILRVKCTPLLQE